MQTYTVYITVTIGFRVFRAFSQRYFTTPTGHRVAGTLPEAFDLLNQTMREGLQEGFNDGLSDGTANNADHQRAKRSREAKAGAQTTQEATAACLPDSIMYTRGTTTTGETVDAEDSRSHTGTAPEGQAWTKRKGDRAGQEEVTERHRSAQARQQTDGEGMPSQDHTGDAQPAQARRAGRQRSTAGTGCRKGTVERKGLSLRVTATHSWIR